MRFIAVCCVALNLIFNVLTAQHQSSIFRQLSIQDGLSQSTVSSVVQDGQGYLWVGTRNGLNRYDGYRFETYKHIPGNPNSISDNWITTIQVDSAGRLWAGTRNRGLTVIDPISDRFIQYFSDHPNPSYRLTSDVITAVTIDASTVWVGSQDGLMQIDQDSVQFGNNFPAYTGKTVSALHVVNGRLLVGTGTGLWSGHTNPVLIPFPDQQRRYINRIHSGPDGTVYVGTRNGLFVFADNRLTALSTPLPHPDVISMLHQSDSVMWVGTYNGLLRYHTKSGRSEIFKHELNDPYSLSNNEIRSLYIDDSDILWIGTYGGGGLNRLNLKAEKFENVRYRPNSETSISDNIVRSFFRDSRDVLWVGTRNGLNRLNADGTYSRFKMGRGAELQPDHEIRVINEDRDGRIWIGTENGLQRMDENGRFTRFTVRENGKLARSQKVFSILSESDRYFWIGTNGSGVFRFDIERKQYQALADIVGADVDVRYLRSISTIYKDSRNRIWIGTFGNGLTVLTESNGVYQVRRFEHQLNTPTSLSSDVIYTVHEDRNHVIWVGTNGGINRFDESSQLFRFFTIADGLPDNYIYGIQSDSLNRLWISTVSGLSLYDRTNETNLFQNYSIQNGLIADEFKLNATYQDRFGNIYFGNTNGYVKIQPASFQSSRFNPNVVITDIRVYVPRSAVQQFRYSKSLRDPISVPDAVVMPYRHNEFTVHFAALDFTSPRANQFAYRLLGYNDDWNFSGTGNQATFTNLNPGEYTFEVRGTNHDLEWSKHIKSIRIRIESPFWQAAWFQFLIFAMIIFIIIFSYRMRIRSIVRKNQELERYVEERTRTLKETQDQLIQVEKLSSIGQMIAGITHEVNTPLAYISSNVDVLGEIMDEHRDMLVKNMDEQTVSAIEQILNSTHTGVEKLTSIVRELRNFSRLDEPDFVKVDLIKTINSALEITKHRVKRITVVKEFKEPLIVDGLTNQLSQVFINIINNSCDAMIDHHTKNPDSAKPKLLIQAGTDEDSALIIFRDNGGGIPQNIMNKIFDPFFTSKPVGQGIGLGLSISYNIIKSHHGSIHVDSEAGVGSIFTIRLPLRQSGSRLGHEPTVGSTASQTNEVR